MEEDSYSAEVARELAEVAASAGSLDRGAFQERAKLAAQRLGPESIEIFPRFYHYPNNPEKPEPFKDQFNRLGEWMELCQLASFEIIQNFDEAVLAYLRNAAFGVYDWPQGFALVALVRLASRGIASQEIIAELCSELPEMRIETYYRAASLLIGIADDAPEVNRVVESIDVAEFQKVLKELRIENEGGLEPFFQAIS